MTEPRAYTVVNGAYTFPSDSCQLVLRRVQRDRYGRIYADADVVTLDGKGYLAIDHGDLGSGRFRKDLAAQAASWNSGTPDVYETLCFQAYIALREDPDVTELVPAPAFVRANEFLQRVPPVSPSVVDGLIERGDLYGLAAKPKTGKTLLVLQLALAVGNGKPWLGRPTTQGRVKLLQLEDSERTLRRRLQAMAKTVPADLWLHVAPFKLTEENYEATVEACHGASLIICDPLIQASNVRDWNAQQEVRDAYERWRRLARDTGAAVVVVMHHRKMEGDYGDQLAGSVQAMASVDGVIELYRDRALDKTARRISFVGRDWADLDDEVVRLDVETLTWQTEGRFSDAKAEAQDAKRQAEAVFLLELLPTAPPGLSYQELEERTGKSTKKVKELLDVLGEAVEHSPGPYSKANLMRMWRRP